MEQPKVLSQSDIMWNPWYRKYYYKKEVDAVLAEKDAEIRRLKELKDKYSSCAEKAINSIAKCELKTYDFPVDHGDFTSTVELFYLKSEADAVIAELKEKYNELAKLHDKAIQACCDADKVIAENY